MSRFKKPLEVKVTGAVLTISIGVETLAIATELNPELECYNEDTGKISQPIITNAKIFAEEICRVLLYEEEDGRTRVHKMFDAAADSAIEDGAEGIRMPGEQV